MNPIYMTVIAWLALAQPGSAESFSPVLDAQVLEERPDIAALALAAATEMRGQTIETTMITFSPVARQALRADKFDYAGFGRPRFTLFRLEQDQADPGRVEVGFVMNFTDSLLRRTSVLLLLTYSVSQTMITVETAVTHQVSAPPTMLLCIVPTERLPLDLLAKATHADLITWVVANRADPVELEDGPTDCLLFAIVYDRLPKGSKLGIRVGNKPEGTSGREGNSRDLNYNGWHVALMRDTFDWRNETPFFVKVLMTDATGTRIVGVLSSDLTPAYPGQALATPDPTPATAKPIDMQANTAQPPTQFRVKRGDEVVIRTPLQETAEIIVAESASEDKTRLHVRCSRTGQLAVCFEGKWMRTGTKDAYGREVRLVSATPEEKEMRWVLTHSMGDRESTGIYGRIAGEWQHVGNIVCDP